MAFGPANSRLGNNKPLYFFCDFEMTGLDMVTDQIIEVAAVLHLASLKPGVRQEIRKNKFEFSSLCHTDKELDEKPQQLTHLTKDRLTHEPPLEEVLTRFFDWIAQCVAIAMRAGKENYRPILAAHGGNRLDYPMIFREVDNSPALRAKFEPLNLLFVDTFFVFKELERQRILRRIENMYLMTIYSAYFGSSPEGHRALTDAKALCRLFTEAKPGEKMHLFLNYIETRADTVFAEKQLQKFRQAFIGPFKGADLLTDGITYEMLVAQYRRSPQSFKGFLERKCQIKYPKQDTIKHFKQLA